MLSSSLSPLSFFFSELILLDTLDADQLGLKHKHTIRGDRSHGPGTITQLRRDGQPPLLTNAHVEQAFIPSDSQEEQSANQPTQQSRSWEEAQREKHSRENSPLDDPTSAELERQRTATAIAGVEFGARVLQ